MPGDMTRKKTQRICAICQRPGVIKAGRRNNKQRYRCKNCNASYSTSRPQASRIHTFSHWMAWLSGKASISELGYSSSTWHRKTAWCWNVICPGPQPTGQACDYLMIDATYIQDWCCLIAYNGTHVIDWQWASTETSLAYELLLKRLVKPSMVIIDGHAGLYRAITRTWSDIPIQRCLFHLGQTVKKHTSLNPRLQAGQEILALTRRLTHVNNAQKAIDWLIDYQTWENTWEDFLKQRTYAYQGRPRPKGTRHDATWWYTHRNLRAVRLLYRSLIKRKQLFTWLEAGSEQNPFPRTTSPLEGGPNKK